MMKEIIINLFSNPVVWAVVLSVFLYVAGILVEKSKTKKDDEIYKIVMGFICNAFNVAEKTIADDSTGNLKKVDVALKSFNSEYARRFGDYPERKWQDLAQAEWSILATEFKKEKAKVEASKG